MPFDGRQFDLTFKLEGLISWLEEQPAEQQYEYFNCSGGCLIGQYLAAHGHAWFDDGANIHNGNGPATLESAFYTVAVKTPRTFGDALYRARKYLAERQS